MKLVHVLVGVQIASFLGRYPYFLDDIVSFFYNNFVCCKFYIIKIEHNYFAHNIGR